jgi:hypothetical protein
MIIPTVGTVGVPYPFSSIIPTIGLFNIVSNTNLLDMKFVVIVFDGGCIQIEKVRARIVYIFFLFFIRGAL